jgi:serine/threonine-protein kinase RsbW
LQQAESSTERHAFTKEFACAGDTGSIAEARDSILQFLTAHGVSGEEQLDWMLALQEALANAVFHGCRDDAGKTIRSTVEITPDEISIVIRDPGAGFDASSSHDAAGGAINLSEHGRGILLMRSLMDEISYSRGGSELRMRKKRAR